MHVPNLSKRLINTVAHSCHPCPTDPSKSSCDDQSPQIRKTLQTRNVSRERLQLGFILLYSILLNTTTLFSIITKSASRKSGQDANACLGAMTRTTFDGSLPDDLISPQSLYRCGPSSAITDGYGGQSFALRALMVLFSGLAMQNALLLLIAVPLTFTKYTGVYFYSLLVASVGVFLHALGFLFKFITFTSGSTKWLSLTLLTIGWYGMVTGQSFVLWSRLHLLVGPGAKGARILRWTKWMIILDAIILHIPTSILTYGSNAEHTSSRWAEGYGVYEKIQLCGFCLQEFVLSTLYIFRAAKLLQNSMRANARRFLNQLVIINIIIMLGDFGLIGTEAASLNLIETMIKAPIYSIKLMLEFVILGRLVQFIGGGVNGPGANEDRWRQAMIAFKSSTTDRNETTPDSRNVARGPEMTVSYDQNGRFKLIEADLTQTVTDRSMSRTTEATLMSDTSTIAVDIREDERHGTSSIRIRRGVSELDIDIARFEHGQDLSFLDWDQSKGEMGAINWSTHDDV